MNCPKCKLANSAKVIDCVKLPKGITYRLRKCNKCDFKFYTAETIVERTPKFDLEWRRNHRSNVINGTAIPREPLICERNMEILAMRKDGHTLEYIAEYFGLSASRVSRIVTELFRQGVTKDVLS